ncbi:hypothetical protein HYFRA_00009389 [Hymenoscyphus fraxineus]|uniref:Carrier domain-containing protein n=1 Tax=Hymenoscyphus fraxineus TaxID=746836 RepID=A0A9N9PVY0_9HELO|nr:hypothetical protein HYFRA_00009389 [Hymenoscyphus fraxineus]
MPSRTSVSLQGYDDLLERDHGLGQLFHSQAQINPSAIAVKEGDDSITYGELHLKALDLASQLRQHEYRREEPTGILVNPGTKDIITQVAVLYAGGTCVTLDPLLPDNQLEERLTRVGARNVLVDEGNQNRLVSLRHIIVDENKLFQNGHSKETKEIVETNLDHCTHLIHTSGTTGAPKPVQILARSILQVVYHAPLVPLDPSDIVVHVNNTSFDVALFDVWAPLLRGASIVIMPKNVLLDPNSMAEALKRYKATVWASTQAIFNLAAVSCPTAFSGLRIMTIGGEAANPKALKTILAAGPPKHLFNAYGPTETCVFSLVQELSMSDTQDESVSIGKPIGRTTIHIVNESMETVKDGEPGELLIGGAGVSRGYLNYPDKNARAFVQVGDAKLYRTGDIVKRKGGLVYYVGRRDHQVKIRGFRVELEAVEVGMLNTGLFSEATALRIESPQEGGGGLLVAYAVPNAQSKDTINIAMKKLKESLPHYMVPKIELIDRLPWNAHAKVDRKKLTELYLEGWKTQPVTRRSKGAGETTTSRLEQLWMEILACPVGTFEEHDDFFAQGGTSLQAAVLIHKIRQTFAIEVSSLALYENSSLGALAKIIDENKDGKVCAIKDETDLWLADSRLAEHLVSSKREPVDWRRDTEGRIFATGVTGFVGAFFLHQLLEMPEVRQVGCLVRAKDKEAGFLRIRECLEKYGLWRAAAAHKILPLPGNLEDETLGFGQERFEELAEWASVVFHLGAHVNYTQPYSIHRPANVIGTVNILRFVAAGKPKSLQYVSSISCFGPTGRFTGTSRVPEDACMLPHLRALPYDHGYAQSQWVVEQMLWTAIGRGFPVAIYRPGFITGHSVTGVSNPDDFFSRLMSACLEMGCYPLLPNQRKEFITVDYVTSAILHMAKNKYLGHAYHIVPKDRNASVDMNETFRLVNHNGFPDLKGIPYGEWIQILSNSTNERLKPLLPMLKEKIHNGMTRWELYEHMPVYETYNTDQALSDYPGGLECPDFDEKLMLTYLNHWKGDLKMDVAVAA